MDWRRFITWSHHLVLPCIVSSCFISVNILESSINIIQHQLSINYPSTICHQRRGSSSALAKASGVGAWKGSMVRFHLPAVVWITFSPSRSRRSTALGTPLILGQGRKDGQSSEKSMNSRRLGNRLTQSTSPISPSSKTQQTHANTSNYNFMLHSIAFYSQPVANL